VKRLLRLYPASWRHRYGTEMSRLLDDLGSMPARRRLTTAVDLLRGALDAHLTRTESHMQAVRRGSVVAVVVWLALSVEIVLSNVVYPTVSDNDSVSVLIGYLGVFAALVVTGAWCARTSTSLRTVAVAGAVTGALIGILTIGTYFFIDNVFLETISHQQTKIDGLARSGMSSMRAYVNSGLALGLVTLAVFLAVAGAALAVLGALAIRRWSGRRLA
jgi:hypothetical protein